MPLIEGEYEAGRMQVIVGGDNHEHHGSDGGGSKGSPNQPQETSDGSDTTADTNNPAAKTTAPEDNIDDIIDPHDSETDRDIADDDIAQDPVAPYKKTKPIGSTPHSLTAPSAKLPTDVTEQDQFEQSDKETPSFEQPYDETTRYVGDTESAVGAKNPTLEKSYSERSEKTSGGSDFYSTKSNNDYKTYFEFENPEEKILIYQSSSSPRQSPEKTPLREKIIDTAAKTADRIDAML